MKFTVVGKGIWLSSEGRYYYLVAGPEDGQLRYLPEGGATTMTEAILERIEGEK